MLDRAFHEMQPVLGVAGRRHVRADVGQVGAAPNLVGTVGVPEQRAGVRAVERAVGRGRLGHAFERVEQEQVASHVAFLHHAVEGLELHVRRQTKEIVDETSYLDAARRAAALEYIERDDVSCGDVERIGQGLR